MFSKSCLQEMFRVCQFAAYSGLALTVVILSSNCTRTSRPEKDDRSQSGQGRTIGQTYTKVSDEESYIPPVTSTSEVMTRLQDFSLECASSQTLIFNGQEWLCQDAPRNLTAISQSEFAEEDFMVIDADGEVTIGKTDGSARLRVNGGLMISNSQTECEEQFEGMLKRNADGLFEQCHNNKWGSVALSSATISSDRVRVPRYEPLLVVDEKPSGTTSGTFSSGAWQIRDLNTIRYDTGNNVVGVSGNELTLKPGMYHCDIHAGAYMVEHHMLRLYNVTADEVEAFGTSDHTDEAAWTGNRSFIKTMLDLDTETRFRLEHRANRSAASGFGTSSQPGWNAPNTHAVFGCVRFH